MFLALEEFIKESEWITTHYALVLRFAFMLHGKMLLVLNSLPFLFFLALSFSFGLFFCLFVPILLFDR